MNKSNSHIRYLFVLASIVLLAALYLISFLCLTTDLKSIFDEGFFFLSFKPQEDFTAFTHPLSLGREILKSIFPSIAQWDVLSLRQLAYWMKILGLIVMGFSSLFFFHRNYKSKSTLSGLSLLSCILLLGLFIIPSVVVSSNDELLFFEMIVLSSGLCSVCFSSKWVKAASACLVGVVSLFAMLCNAPGGVMLFVLTVAFICFFPDFNWSHVIRTTLFSISGLVLGIVIMHFTVTPISDSIEFVKEAVAQTASSGATSNHSLTKLLVSILLNIRNLIITVVSLLGITFVSLQVKRFSRTRWMPILVGLILFFIYFKWQVKPGVGFGNILTWLFLMFVLYCTREQRLQKSEWVLILFLFLMPFCMSIGSNSGFVFKAQTVIVPWGILLYYMVKKIYVSNPLYATVLYLFVFVLVMIGPGHDILNCLSRESYQFNQEKPIARMHLSKAQHVFYNEVYDALGNYGYKSQQDTILGFCFNEMTIVAVDAIPYSNDQQPEDFLLHQGPLPRPSFLILGEWDKKRLSSYFDTLGWRLTEDYDILPLMSNPDPNSGYNDAQSTLYCLKSRRLLQ